MKKEQEITKENIKRIIDEKFGIKTNETRKDDKKEQKINRSEQQKNNGR